MNTETNLILNISSQLPAVWQKLWQRSGHDRIKRWHRRLHFTWLQQDINKCIDMEFSHILKYFYTTRVNKRLSYRRETEWRTMSANACHVSRGTWVRKVSNSKWPSGSFKDTSNGATRQATYDFLFVFHCNYSVVFQRLPEPNRVWLLGNRSLTLVASGSCWYTRSHKLFHIRKVGGVAR